MLSTPNPAWNTKVSLPAAPVSVSLPAPPSMTLALPSPRNVSAKALPVAGRLARGVFAVGGCGARAPAPGLVGGGGGLGGAAGGGGKSPPVSAPPPPLGIPPPGPPETPAAPAPAAERIVARSATENV